MTDADTPALAYSERGAGERVVIALHGLLGSGRNLGALVRGWVARDPSLRVIVPDVRGHGTSPPLPSGADLELLARDVLALAEARAPGRRVLIVGHSLGGRIALFARGLDPARCSGVVLLDASPEPPGPEASEELDRVVTALQAAPAEVSSRRELIDELTRRDLSSGLAEWLAMNLVPAGERLVWRFDRAALARLLPATRRDLWPVIDALGGSEISLIRGARSAFVTPAAADRLRRAGGRVVEIAGAGHFLHAERPAEVVRALAELYPPPGAH